MLELVVENVRSFAGRHTVPIAPLTILTGENSSGKSTFLAALAMVCDPQGFPFLPAFNRAPYQLGNYDTIATYKGGKFGRAKSFTIGYKDDHPRQGIAAAAEATFRSRDGQPELASLHVSGPGGRAAIDIETATGRTFSGILRLSTTRGDAEMAFEIPSLLGSSRALSLPDLLLGAQRASDAGDLRKRVELLRRMEEVAYLFSPMQSVSIAPIRTKPERTYGEIADRFEPGGDQVPFVLERLFRDEGSRDAKAVMAGLERFGRESGLFRTVGVKKFGSKAGEPFQITVNVGGRARNLIDVGYGVSQALPIIVQSALTPAVQLLLVQQPEVHLHPRAQAALGTFFAELTAQAGKRIVIETHSDYIIDRIRQEVAAGRLNPNSTSILFFERQGMETKVHPVAIDRDGNIRHAPPSYRSFFLEEEIRLLERTESHVSNR